MLKAVLKFRRMQFKDKEKKAYKDTLKAEFKKACQAHIETTASAVHSYSGQALSALIPVAKQLQAVQRVQRYLHINSLSNLRWARKEISPGVWGPPFPIKGPPRWTPTAGERQGRSSYFDKDAMDYSVQINNDNQDRNHYLINEFVRMNDKWPQYWGNLKEPLPWFSLRSGKEAFYEYRDTFIYKKLKTLKLITFSNEITSS